MPEPKLYKVVFQTEIMILAQSEAEALRNAQHYVKDEVPSYLSSDEVISKSELGEWTGCLPYCAHSSYNEYERTCDEFVP